MKKGWSPYYYLRDQILTCNIWNHEHKRHIMSHKLIENKMISFFKHCILLIIILCWINLNLHIQPLSNIEFDLRQAKICDDSPFHKIDNLCHLGKGLCHNEGLARSSFDLSFFKDRMNIIEWFLYLLIWTSFKCFILLIQFKILFSNFWVKVVKG